VKKEGLHHAGTLPFNTDHHKVDATLPKKTGSITMVHRKQPSKVTDEDFKIYSLQHELWINPT
jgi:hypothetical protein